MATEDFSSGTRFRAHLPDLPTDTHDGESLLAVLVDFGAIALDLMERIAVSLEKLQRTNDEAMAAVAPPPALRAVEDPHAD